VILCGLRDVRDYKAASGGDPDRLGTSSPFNIKLESLRIDSFSPDELRELYAQHTADTGQLFSEAALQRAWEATAGQPWLVNALAREIVEKMAVPASEVITANHVAHAKERLILDRATHLDSLAHKLAEPRVQRVVEPVLAGTYAGESHAYEDELSYVRDLGLIALDNPPRIANPIYREVIARVLAAPAEIKLPAPAPGAFLLPDRRLAWKRMMRAFASFWREHGEVLASGMPYPEVAPQLVLMAFLQRVVNGGGFIDREYGVGRGRMDLLVRFPYRKADGARAVQRRALELKVWRPGQKSPLRQGLTQIDEYLARHLPSPSLGAASQAIAAEAPGRRSTGRLRPLYPPSPEMCRRSAFEKLDRPVGIESQMDLNLATVGSRPRLAGRCSANPLALLKLHTATGDRKCRARSTSGWLLGFSEPDEGRPMEKGERFWARTWFKTFPLVRA
jgi:hypothetical protein